MGCVCGWPFKNLRGLEYSLTAQEAKTWILCTSPREEGRTGSQTRSLSHPVDKNKYGCHSQPAPGPPVTNLLGFRREENNMACRHLNVENTLTTTV